MKNIKKFINFLSEANDMDQIPTENEEEKVLDPNTYTELVNGIKKLISETIDSNNEETIKVFIKVYVKNPEEKEIIGLINDADVYEFYLKYMSDIDEILTFSDFYSEKPDSLEVYSLYDYLVKGTKVAVLELLRKIV
jgi:hypothetical protein